MLAVATPVPILQSLSPRSKPAPRLGWVCDAVFLNSNRLREGPGTHVTTISSPVAANQYA